ncbi:TlpA family protein disulfide reductase [Sphingobacterium multivorum]|uniref:TlpA family protein disulfide reductase n=1 Tax=Sphingobacterium multivorum TaxID=28454 RepID=UPI0028990A5D|nr:TlpA disulfide reductase family protein [Sphingobacterium multivorum]
MKNIILFFFGLFYGAFSFSQSRTKISINIQENDTTKLNAQIYLQDPTMLIDSGYFNESREIKGGKCEFLLDIKKPSLFSLKINDKFISFPGTYYLIVEPYDDIVLDLPAFTEAGFYGFGMTKIVFNGKGSKKLKLTQNIIRKNFEIFKTDPITQSQSLTYRFETTDRKLNVIDSLLRKNTIVPYRIKNLIKAQLYSSLLESLFRICMTTPSDSLRPLFQKFVVDKKRMDIYKEKGIINYFGAENVPSYLLLLEFKNPVVVGGKIYQIESKLKYAELLVSRLSMEHEVRDYLLSDHVIKSIKNGVDSTTVKLYNYYIEKCDFNNPNYANVVKLYSESIEKNAVGKRFYDFSLPDSSGRYYTLSDFKGKIVVIDFWFYGCVGCKQMTPALKAIEQNLNQNDINFVSIGIDKKDLWLKGIGNYSSPNSLQLFTDGQTSNHPIIKTLNIDAYPRLIVLDRNGNIASTPPDPRSKRDSFVNYLKSLN